MSVLVGGEQDPDDWDEEERREGQQDDQPYDFQVTPRDASCQAISNSLVRHTSNAAPIKPSTSRMTEIAAASLKLSLMNAM